MTGILSRTASSLARLPVSFHHLLSETTAQILSENAAGICTFQKKKSEKKILGPLATKIKGHTVNSSFAPSIPTIYHKDRGNEVSKIFIISLNL